MGEALAPVQAGARLHGGSTVVLIAENGETYRAGSGPPFLGGLDCLAVEAIQVKKSKDMKKRRGKKRKSGGGGADERVVLDVCDGEGAGSEGEVLY